jgi:cell division protein FtsL
LRLSLILLLALLLIAVGRVEGIAHRARHGTSHA